MYPTKVGTTTVKVTDIRGSPTVPVWSRLYEGVQKFMDHLINGVEDRLLGLDDADIH